MFSACAFVLREELQKAGIDKSRIVSMYSLWNSRLPRDSYVIVGMDRRGIPANAELYGKLLNDRRYEKFVLHSGN